MITSVNLSKYLGTYNIHDYDPDEVEFINEKVSIVGKWLIENLGKGKLIYDALESGDKDSRWFAVKNDKLNADGIPRLIWFFDSEDALAFKLKFGL